MKKTQTAGAVTLESLPWYVRFFRYMRRYWFLYLLVLPGLVFLFVFDYGPMYGIQLAFKDYHANLGIWGSPWVGLENFKTMVNDANFWRAFKNTVIINCYMIFFSTVFTIFLSLMLNEMRLKRLKSVVQTATYLPYFLSWVIFSGLVQVFLEYPSSTGEVGGVLNQLLVMMGHDPINFLTQPDMFRTIVVVSDLIKSSGYGTIVYLASMATINPSLYEAAKMDGANRGDMMWHITLPAIKPTIVILLILNLAGLFSSNFDQIYNLYNNYVLSTGDVMSTYLYRISLGGGTQFEVSTAISLVSQLLGLVVVLATNKIVSKMDVMGIF
jgi:putative aldouronate transport system permease protein